MNLMRAIATIVAVSAVSACDVEPLSPGQIAAAQTSPSQVAAAPVSASAAELAARAQSIAEYFDEESGQNLGDGWHYDRAYAEGNRATIEIQAPVSGRLYRNNDNPNDPLRRDIRRSLCTSTALAQFMATGGEIRYIVEGYDNVRIGAYLFNRPC